MIYENLSSYLQSCISLSKKRKLKILISFHQTSKSCSRSNKNYYTLPPRVFNNYLLAGYCNLNQEYILMIAEKFNKEVNKFIVDLEKKGFVGIGKSDNLLTGNLEGRLEEIVDRKKILGIRFDSLTAEHVVNNLIKENPFLYKRSISVIGLGNIGFKIAMSLLECGNNVEIYSRNYKKTFEKCNCMDILKPSSTLARPILHREIESSLINKNIIILATNSSDIINKTNCKLINKKARIISVGHEEISREAANYFNKNTKVNFSRVDIGKSLIQYITRLIDSDEIIPKRKRHNKNFFVSGGFIGLPGDYVSDDAENPQLIFGFITQDGKFKRELKIFDIEKDG